MGNSGFFARARGASASGPYLWKVLPLLLVVVLLFVAPAHGKHRHSKRGSRTKVEIISSKSFSLPSYTLMDADHLAARKWHPRASTPRAQAQAPSDQPLTQVSDRTLRARASTPRAQAHAPSGQPLTQVSDPTLRARASTPRAQAQAPSGQPLTQVSDHTRRPSFNSPLWRNERLEALHLARLHKGDTHFDTDALRERMRAKAMSTDSASLPVMTTQGTARAPAQVPRPHAPWASSMAPIMSTPETDALLAVQVDLKPTVLPGPAGAPTIMPLVLTAPERRKHAAGLLGSLNVSDPERALFPAPMYSDSRSGVKEFYKAWDCAAAYGRFRTFRVHMMWQEKDAAVFLGHARMLRHFLNASDADFLLAMEDDAVVGGDVTAHSIHELVARVTKELASGMEPWDLINLGQSNYDYCPGKRLITGIKFTKKADAHAVIHPTGIVFGTLGLLYTRKGAATVFEAIRAHGPVVFASYRDGPSTDPHGCFTYDDWLFAGKRCQQLIIAPPLFYQDHVTSIRLSGKFYEKPKTFCKL